MRSRLIVVAWLATLLLAGCGGESSSPSDGIAHPAGDRLVLRIERRGGLVPPEAQLTGLPSFSLLGDGRVVRSGAMIDIFPGPLMPPLSVRQLSEHGIQAVLREVAATHLFGASRHFDGAALHVADAPDTVFELHADGVEVTISVYALGMAAQDLPGDQAAAYAALSALEQRVSMLESWLPASAWAQPAEEPFVADAVRLLVRDATDDGPDPSGIGFTLVPWPGSADPAEGKPFREWRCSVVSGEEAVAWNDQLAKANGLTRWTQGDQRSQVLPVPLLPDQPRECPAA
jgi:hypothetical protein